MQQAGAAPKGGYPLNGATGGEGAACIVRLFRRHGDRWLTVQTDGMTHLFGVFGRAEEVVHRRLVRTHMLAEQSADMPTIDQRVGRKLGGDGNPGCHDGPHCGKPHQRDLLNVGIEARAGVDDKIDLVAIPHVQTGDPIEFADPEIEVLQEKIAERLGYRLEGHRLEL